MANGSSNSISGDTRFIQVFGNLFLKFLSNNNFYFLKTCKSKTISRSLIKGKCKNRSFFSRLPTLLSIFRGWSMGLPFEIIAPFRFKF